MLRRRVAMVWVLVRWRREVRKVVRRDWARV